MSGIGIIVMFRLFVNCIETIFWSVFGKIIRLLLIPSKSSITWSVIQANCTETIMVIVSKQLSTRARLEEIARKIGPGGQMPRIRQLGADIGVSLSTLNAALSDLEDRDMIRRRQGSGIFVGPGLGRRNLCLICNPQSLLDFGTSPIWSQLIEAARGRVKEESEQLSIHFTQIATELSTEAVLDERLVRDIDAGNVHGVLAIGLPHSLTRWIESCGVPVVSFAGASNYIVDLMVRQVIEIGVAELKRQGCHALVLWYPQSAHQLEPAPVEFIEAFQTALMENALPYRADLAERFEPRILADAPWTKSFPGQGYEAMMHLAASSGKRPDGILSVDDMLTQGLLMAMGRSGLQAGRDIHVATQTNRYSPALLGWEKTITQIEFDPAEIIGTMFEALETLLRGEVPAAAVQVAPDENQPDYQPPEKRILLRPRLIHSAALDNHAECG